MSTIPRSATSRSPGPTLDEIAGAAHRHRALGPSLHLVSAQVDQGRLTISYWPLTANLDHPADSLVGFVAPRRWLAVGLTVAGPSTRITLMMDIWGSALVQRGPSAGAAAVHDHHPSGWLCDLLARTLRLPTPAPTETTSALVEATWLDRLMTAALARPDGDRTWGSLADRHPLRGTGATPPAGSLRQASQDFATDHPWSSLRRWGSPTSLPAQRWRPAVGSAMGASQWFDDGSLSRWTLQFLAPPEELFTELRSVLDPEPADHLARALVSVGPHRTTP